MTRDEAIEKWEVNIKAMKDTVAICEQTPFKDKHQQNLIGMFQNIIKAFEEVVGDFEQIDEPKWHKVKEEGLPKEEGTYLVCIQACEDCLKNYQTAVYDGQKFILLLVLTGALGNADITKNVIAWQKIEPYEGSK